MRKNRVKFLNNDHTGDSVKEQHFYRKYIAGVVARANQQRTVMNSSIVYGELTKWLREKDTKLEHEMFKAVLAVSRSLSKDYLKSGEVSITKSCNAQEMLFHTGTGTDDIHTDASILRQYVKEFWPVLKERLDEESQLGDVGLRYRRGDVVRLGKLFDQILKCVDDDTKTRLVDLMDEFVKSDLEE